MKPVVDDVIMGQVRRVVPHECLLVSFGAGLLGRVDITDMSDEYGDHPLTKSLTHSIVKYVSELLLHNTKCLWYLVAIS